MRSRLLIVVLVALAIVSAAAAAVLVTRINAASPPQAGSGEALIGGPFALTDHEGRRVTDADFRGRLMLVYFGYVYCPDVCPLGLQTIAEALDLLPPPAAERIVPLFVTVDPERDTVSVVRDYVGAFHPRLVGLTGTPAEIAAVTKAYRVYARRAAAQGSADYLVDHSTFTYVMGPDGRYLAHFGHGTTPEAMADRLRELATAA